MFSQKERSLSKKILNNYDTFVYDKKVAKIPEEIFEIIDVIYKDVLSWFQEAEVKFAGGITFYAEKEIIQNICNKNE